jgi:hypothetical protein
MLIRPLHIQPFKAAIALAVLASVGQADAARTRPVSTDAPIHVTPAIGPAQGSVGLPAEGVDAERVFQGEPLEIPRAASTTTLPNGAELSPLPASAEFEPPVTGEVRGKLLLQAMADLPQVGVVSSNPSLTLDFWDDAASARSAVDDRASADLASPANGRSEAHSNVMIPLPMAAWSGLSVLGGVGIVGGLRRLKRRFTA